MFFWLEADSQGQVGLTGGEVFGKLIELELVVGS